MGVALGVALLCPPAAWPQPPLELARALLMNCHTDPLRIDQARTLLEDAARDDGSAEVMSELARAWFLVGEVRATSSAERLEAYFRGREAGRRAVDISPNSEAAHVWYVINSGRWAETKGIFRAMFMLPMLREEMDLVLKLNPASVEGNTLKGSLLAELPKMLGGDRVHAEEHFKNALAADPHRSGPRVELARLYIATGRTDDARRELHMVLQEPAPSDRPYWALRDAPRARELLEQLPAAVSVRAVGSQAGNGRPDGGDRGY